MYILNGLYTYVCMHIYAPIDKSIYPKMVYFKVHGN